MARPILAGMGYAIIPIEEWLEDPRLIAKRPELCIAEESRVEDVPTDRDFARLPIITLTGRSGVTSGDPRVVGGIPAPAGLHELYRLLQQTLEVHPRSCLRVPTEIAARVKQKDREWTASLLSLSESGCLLRSTEPLAMATPMEIMFDLPRLGRVKTQAEPTYQFLPDTGVVFERTPPGHRRSIQIYVESQLG